MPKISFRGEPPVPHEDIERNLRLSKDRPRVAFDLIRPHGRALAVVGGGPSLLDQIDTLRDWRGDLWAINGVCGFLRERGIHSTFFAADPHPIVAQWARGAVEAIVASRCAPEAFAELKWKVTVFDFVQDSPGGIVGCSSTAGAAFHLATSFGYRDVTFFGCEGSYQGSYDSSSLDMTHAYMNEPREDRMLVECGGWKYLTAPDLYIQSIELSTLIKIFSSYFHERSGGLLRAMIENEDHDIVMVSNALLEKISPRPEHTHRPLTGPDGITFCLECGAV